MRLVWFAGQIAVTNGAAAVVKLKSGSSDLLPMRMTADIIVVFNS